jgi:peptidoglycan/LPS O-acetylase OafA/YrhL
MTAADNRDAVPRTGIRIDALDGIRGLAALFVVLHHCWLMSFPGFPAATGPVWLGWLAYGHFAVVVFITLSGFSLAVSPARNGWRLGGKARFAQRRAWRILPPYWAALVLSLIVAWTIVPQPGSEPPTLKSVVVYGLLLQDIVGSPVPNGAFWSIAVEAQLYLVFPVLLLLMRRLGTVATLTAVTVPVVTIGLLAPRVPAVDDLRRLTPQFAVLFALGLVAAGIIAAGDRLRRLPWHWLAATAILPVLLVIVVRGSAWTVGNFYWVDIAIGPAAALLLAAIATGRPASLVRLPGTGPLRSLGRFSYSLYLIHSPIVVVVALKVVGPYVGPGLPAFAATAALAVTASLLVARLFAAVFEIPFQRYRSWAQIRAAVAGRAARRRDVPAPAPAGEAAYDGAVDSVPRSAIER